METRSAKVARNTKETQIELTLNLDGSGKCSADTGIGFFDHMLDGFTRHGLFDLTLKVNGDLHVDAHHTVEDTGIVLGTAIREAAGDKVGIRRFGSAIIPMDEALVLCAVDISGRPYLSFDLQFAAPMAGTMQTELFREFFYAVSYSAGMNIHLRQLSGGNDHHVIEAAYKAFARALDEALTADPRVKGVPSTKGSL